PPRREHTFPASEIVGHRSAGNEPPSAGDGNGPPAADGANNGRGDSNGKEDSKDTSATDVNAADGGVATKSTDVDGGTHAGSTGNGTEKGPSGDAGAGNGDPKGPATDARPEKPDGGPGAGREGGGRGGGDQDGDDAGRDAGPGTGPVGNGSTGAVEDGGTTGGAQPVQGGGGGASQRLLSSQPSAVEEVGTFHPAPNITVDRTGSSMRISGTIKAYGSDADATKAATAQATIRQYWKGSFPDGYAVTCDIVVSYEASPSTSWNEATIEMTQISGPSKVWPATPTMTLNMREGKDLPGPDPLTWTVAHEFGHQLGLKDRYSEGLISQIKGEFGGKRTATVDPGYEGNLMGVSGGQTSSKNVADLGTENSPWFWQDDDWVREWVARNPNLLSAMSATSKIRMIGRLMEGWISDDDIKAIGRICASVSDVQSSQVKSYLQ